ncbi:hypothetical protein [Tunturiibacter gelidiferens]|uniref:hypothetical protein n=1 Tax=Tunturiibacter gelidiferens TaxID=3069689 RepID=UPI003D9B95F5
MRLTVESFTVPRVNEQFDLEQMRRTPEFYFERRQSHQYPLVIESDEELEQFLGGLVSDIGHTVSNVVKAVDKVVPISKIAKGIGDVASAVDKVVPISLLVPGGVVMRFAGDTASRVARGENVFKAIESAGRGALGDVKKGLQLASMVAGFVPGIGTGVGAALGAASALANGEPITEALIAAARSALPGGAIAKAAFDMAANLAKGKNIGEAALSTLRSQLPNNPIAQAAFDAGVSLSKGQSIQQAALAATGKLLPKSPLADGALSFVNKVMSGQNIQTAALSMAGNLAFKKLQQAGGIKVPGVGTVTIPRLSGSVPAIRGVSFGPKIPSAIAPAFSAGAKALGRIELKARDVAQSGGATRVLGTGAPKMLRPPSAQVSYPMLRPQIGASTGTGRKFPAPALQGLRGLGQSSGNLAAPQAVPLFKPVVMRRILVSRKMDWRSCRAAQQLPLSIGV